MHEDVCITMSKAFAHFFGHGWIEGGIEILIVKSENKKEPKNKKERKNAHKMFFFFLLPPEQGSIILIKI